MKYLLLAAGLAISIATFPAVSQAEDLSQDQIVEGLKPKKLTRSLKGDANGLTADQKQEIDGILKLKRSIGVVQREKVAEIVEKAKLPKLDFEIYFEYDSDRILPESLPVLDKLGNALHNPALASSKYLVNGHTDAKGSDGYNQELSERRAAAVVAYLAQYHGIDAGYLQPLGYGESRLKDPAYPDDAANRRVEIVNLTY